MQFGGCQPDDLIMPKRIELDIEKIVSMYTDDLLSAKKIGNIVGVSGGTILGRLREEGVPAHYNGCKSDSEKDTANSTYKNREWLVEQYINMKKSGRQISIECGVCGHTILDYIDKNNITRREDEINETYHNKEWLTEQYVTKKRSANSIAKECDVCGHVISRSINKHSIEKQPRKHIKDLSSKKFGRLKVLYMNKRTKENPLTSWMCKCDCGATLSVLSGNLCSGHTRSCGCLSRDKASERRGENHQNWNHEKTDKERRTERSYPGYREWRKKVLERDNYTCQKCMETSKSLQAHHIESYNINKHLRTVLDNGVTLCVDCHDNFHHIYGKGNNTREQFNEFMLMEDE